METKGFRLPQIKVKNIFHFNKAKARVFVLEPTDQQSPVDDNTHVEPPAPSMPDIGSIIDDDYTFEGKFSPPAGYADARSMVPSSSKLSATSALLGSTKPSGSKIVQGDIRSKTSKSLRQSLSQIKSQSSSQSAGTRFGETTSQSQSKGLTSRQTMSRTLKSTSQSVCQNSRQQTAIRSDSQRSSDSTIQTGSQSSVQTLLRSAGQRSSQSPKQQSKQPSSQPAVTRWPSMHSNQSTNQTVKPLGHTNIVQSVSQRLGQQSRQTLDDVTHQVISQSMVKSNLSVQKLPYTSKQSVQNSAERLSINGDKLLLQHSAVSARRRSSLVKSGLMTSLKEEGASDGPSW